MKKIYYDDGPDRIIAGIAGEFHKGISKELHDDIAALLLKKPLFKEVKTERPKRKEE